MSSELTGLSCLTQNLCAVCFDENETVQKAYLGGKWIVTHERI